MCGHNTALPKCQQRCLWALSMKLNTWMLSALRELGGMRWCPHQVHALFVLEGADERDNVLMALEVVHDLHFPPHIIHILLCPAHTKPQHWTSRPCKPLPRIWSHDSLHKHANGHAHVKGESQMWCECVTVHTDMCMREA